MSDEKDVVVDDVVEDIQTEQTVDVDLSSVPEKHRDYVDVEKYSSDADYKRAIDHGYMPEKLFEESGKDKEFFTGYKAWVKNFDKRQEEKATKAALAELRKGQEALISTFAQQKEQAVREAIAQKEAELKLAIQDNDAMRALEINNELTQAKAAQATTKKAPALSPVIRDFIEDHPALNETSPDFNPQFAQKFWAETTQEADEFMRSQGGRNLTHPEIEYYLNRGMKRMSKELPQKTVVKAPVVAKPATTAKVTELKNKLTAEAQTTYNRLLSAKGGGKEAADAFAKEVLGGVK